jgi:hypothetical protein
VNEIEHHLIWEAMGPLLKKDSLGMVTNKLEEGLPHQSSQGYVNAKLYAARMRYGSAAVAIGFLDRGLGVRVISHTTHLRMCYP